LNDVKLKYIVDKETTVKDILLNRLDISSRLLKKLKLEQRIFCNGKNVWVNDKVSIGDEISVNITFEEKNDKIKAQKGSLDVLYEDDSLLIINKSGDMVVHPTCLHLDCTLANYVKYYLEEKGEFVTTRFVNRLDRETSGIIIFAKNDYTQEVLARQMQSGIFEKEYIAVVHGIVKDDFGTINLPIKRAPNSIMEGITAEDGERAITHYEVIERLTNTSVVKLKLETGRTHQIRVHLKSIGHPIIGDGLYSDIPTDLIKRQALHAYKVKFIHPITKENVEIISKVPDDIGKIINNKEDYYMFLG